MAARQLPYLHRTHSLAIGVMIAGESTYQLHTFQSKIFLLYSAGAGISLTWVPSINFS